MTFATATVHVNDDGVASTLPATSTARTVNVCDASDSPTNVAPAPPAVHAAKAPASILHWNVAVASFEWKLKVASAVRDGSDGNGESRSVSGGLVSRTGVVVFDVECDSVRNERHHAYAVDENDPSWRTAPVNGTVLLPPA